VNSNGDAGSITRGTGHSRPCSPTERTAWHQDRSLEVHPHVFGPQVFIFATCSSSHSSIIYPTIILPNKDRCRSILCLAHRTCSGWRTSTPASFRNVAHLARSNVPPIQQTFSMQARQAVGRPFGAYHIPKAPGFTPRSVSQVGLGTARSFHSSRPLFQNLVDNAPIALRAFTEADWELETKGKQPARWRSERRPTR
jgi:hypothetical protein